MEYTHRGAETPNQTSEVPAKPQSPHPYMQMKPAPHDGERAFSVSGKPITDDGQHCNLNNLGKPARAELKNQELVEKEKCDYESNLDCTGKTNNGHGNGNLKKLGDSVASGRPLSNLHISPRPAERFTRRPRRLVYQPHSQISVVEDGSMVTLSRRREAKRLPGGGTRGEIKGFSSASANRIRKRVCRLRRTHRPIFGTVTYPGMWYWTAESIKADLDRFAKKFVRRFPHLTMLWKLETKRRKSGVLEGMVMPHFHMLIYGAENPHFRDMGAWWRDAWADSIRLPDGRNVTECDEEFSALTGRRNEHELRTGPNRVEFVRSPQGVMWYAAKYLSKCEESDEPIGRFWGIINRKIWKALEGKTTVIAITEAQADAVYEMIRQDRLDDWLEKRLDAIAAGRPPPDKEPHVNALSCWHITDSNQWVARLAELFVSL